MTHLRLACLTVGLFLSASRLSAQTPKQIEPTDEQLHAAKKAIESIGGVLEKQEVGQQVVYVIRLGMKTTDQDLKRLPKIPFPFGLELALTQVTNAGLKELAKLNNLILLELYETK